MTTPDYIPSHYVDGAAANTPLVSSNLNKSEAAIASLHGATGLNVRDYGAVGDGTHDDSTAFQACYTAASALVVASWSFSGEKVGRVKIIVPPGRYLITQAGSLMASSGPPALTFGLTIEGHGEGISEIVFTPATGPGSFLAVNTTWRGLTFRDLSFLSGTTDASFMSSTMTTNHAVQDYRFERCHWDGPWQYGNYLAGPNNVDSITWDHCTMSGRWTGGFLYCSSTDQFVNYNFRDCKAEMQSGYFVVLPYGGAVNCIGGSYIFIDTTATGVFFTMPYQSSHGDATQRLLVQGIRFELRALTHSLISCEWVGGIVHFDNCDDSTWATLLTGASTQATAIFDSHSQQGPIVLWTNCNLVGQHTYKYGNLSYQYKPLVKYDSCNLRSWSEPSQFVLTPAESGATNVGGATPVEFVNCRGGTTTTPWLYPPDLTVNWSTSPACLKRRAVSFKTAYGSLPYTTAEPTLELWLPLGAMITGLRFHKMSGTGTSAATTWSYTIKTNESTPTTLGSVTGGGTTAWTSGFSSTLVVDNFVCNSDARRHLTLTAAAITQITTDCLAIVEYYG